MERSMETKVKGYFVRGDERNGEFHRYSIHGYLMQVIHYKDGTWHGKYEQFYGINGEKYQVGNYENGSLHGKFVTYSIDGEIVEDVIYEDGILQQ